MIIAATSSLNACKKNEEPPILNSYATVTFQGLISSDGCGYVVIIDNVTYHPENLPEDFRADNLKVKVNAHFTGERFQCGLAANLSYPIIHINSISKR
ncbi:hypothetical protein GCM10028827_42320 [Mucilaginibacter myungsuensis]